MSGDKEVENVQGVEEVEKTMENLKEVEEIEVNKQKVERENLKNLQESAKITQTTQIEKRTENNNEAESLLAKQVDDLDISSESTKEAEESKVTVTNESSSLRNILTAYDSDESSSSSDSTSSATSVYVSGTEDSEEDSDESESEFSNETEEEIEFISEVQGAIKKTDKSKGKEEPNPILEEMGLDLLPPVPDMSKLNINPEKEEFFHMGHIRAIIDRIVTVEALPNIPAYDLDTPLFYGEDKRPLGVVFDVIGQVTSPTYAVRFNSQKDISDAKIERGLKVFSAPKCNHTQYVFVRELLKLKGSDASWVGDMEVPDEMQEFSDDDDEHTKKGGKKLENQSRKRAHCSQERHKRFERSMNQCNTINTRVHRLIDARNNPAVRGANHRMINAFENVVFDPSRPPPGFAHAQSRLQDFSCYASGSTAPPKQRYQPSAQEVPFMEYSHWAVSMPGDNLQGNWLAAPEPPKENSWFSNGGNVWGNPSNAANPPNMPQGSWDPSSMYKNS
ncbi:unnamed protein product [Brassicogethes aeneus]|uniref:H/ACA ribonucleoprotein complex non-core subunit NAF1 n=1 Tax=Brassicogethes aeneus TaxID=1431903 RepID=A0A9P0BIG9_BRAAE|nr:unnamed protein product [Brassicogethes aeneus]